VCFTKLVELKCVAQMFARAFHWVDLSIRVTHIEKQNCRHATYSVSHALENAFHQGSDFSVLVSVWSTFF